MLQFSVEFYHQTEIKLSDTEIKLIDTEIFATYFVCRRLSRYPNLST